MDDEIAAIFLSVLVPALIAAILFVFGVMLKRKQVSNRPKPVLTATDKFILSNRPGDYEKMLTEIDEQLNKEEI